MKNYVHKVSLIGLALLLVLATTVLLGSWVMAAVPSGSGTTKIVLMTKGYSQGDNPGISLSAHLTDADKPLGNQPVEFDVTANFFGDRQVNIGTVQTDATGTATLVYQPTWDGTYNFTAHYAGDGSYANTDTTSTFTYSGPVPQYAPEAVGLQSVRQWITPVIYAGVGLFWLFLIVIGAVTLVGIYRERTRVVVKSELHDTVAVLHEKLIR